MVVDARQGVYVPRLQREECSRCGLCYDACPGHSIDMRKLTIDVFGGEPADVLLGHVTGTYLAHSTDRHIRRNAASGGLASSLLVHALEQGLIDRALVTRMRPDSPLEPEPFIAGTAEQVREAMASKYCPVPANVALRTVLDEDGRYAVVGLPCHIHGVRRAEAASKVLRERVALRLGIFCSHSSTFRATTFLLKKLGVRENDVRSIAYRGAGWPGGITVRLADGSERFISTVYGSVWSSMFGSFFFTPTCCLSCPDVLNELADVSLGDPWLPQVLSTEREGKSLVISRSPAGDALLRSAVSAGAVELSDLDPADVARSQRTSLHFKKVNLASRLSYLGSARERVKTPGPRGSRRNRFLAAVPVINQRFASSGAGRYLLDRCPSFILQRYHRWFHGLHSRSVDNDFDSRAETR